ncbi:hypothetical protein SAMN05216327_12011 [Dyadobacter sp. SG02]|nr:hypothetical protein SAMN05216327_12011 [Dyadobacter sp. SG02]
MLSKVHFWVTVIVRWISLLFQPDKSISLKRFRSPDGVIVCKWKNALWIELPSGQRSSSTSWVSGNHASGVVAGHVTVHGFYRKQLYSATALLFNESFAIQPFRCVVNESPIAFQQRLHTITARPIRVSGGIKQVKSKSIEIKHNTFSKITLP